jgi:hypothetical protein
MYFRAFSLFTPMEKFTETSNRKMVRLYGNNLMNSSLFIRQPTLEDRRLWFHCGGNLQTSEIVEWRERDSGLSSARIIRWRASIQQQIGYLVFWLPCIWVVYKSQGISEWRGCKTLPRTVRTSENSVRRGGSEVHHQVRSRKGSSDGSALCGKFFMWQWKESICQTPSPNDGVNNRTIYLLKWINLTI